MTPLIAALAAMTVIGGVILIAVGVTPAPVVVTPQSRPRGRAFAELMGTDRTARRLRLAGLVGLALGVLVAVTTGWLITIVVAPAAAVGIPMLLMTSQGRKAIERIEAMEEWTRSLAGVLGAGVGLEQAIQSTLSRSTPAAIRPEVALLVGRLRARWRTSDALRAFADDLSDPTGDAIVAGLLLAADRRGQGLASMLEGIAERAAEDVRNRRRIEADLAKPRSTARWVTLITVGVLGLMAIFNREYIAPYGSALGQLILVVLLSAYVGALLWMRQMAKGEELPRFLGEAARTPRKA